MSHTATPWIAEMQLTADGRHAGTFAIWTNEKNPHYIADVPLEANAAHIVRCVNAYQSLVDALEKVQLFGENVDSLSIGHVAALQELARNAKAALAKAKE